MTDRDFSPDLPPGSDDPQLAEELRTIGAAHAPAVVRISVAEAISNNWLEIWYQSKIDLRRKCLAGAEALMRIRHPQDGVLWPETFIPETDEDGLAQLSEHALLAMLRDWTTFAEAGFNLHLAMNVPANVLAKLPLAEFVAQNRPKTDTWPGLIIEITEDQVVQHIELAQTLAPRFKESGVTIAVDGFGAGYSLVSSLRTLPFAELKLGNSFVKNCATDPNNAAICQTAIDLAHRFGSAAVAEGIESMMDLQALVAMGCDFGQGPLVAPPMPQARFLELLRQRLNKPEPTAADAAADASPAPSVGRVA